MHSFRIRLLYALTLTLYACAGLALQACSVPEDAAPIGEEIPDEPLFILRDAYRGNERYFLRYSRGGETYYATGDLRTSITRAESAAASYDTPKVSSMEPLELDPWLKLTRNMRPIPILQVEQWSELRTRLFKGLVPRQANEGVAVSFDRLDYFFFYDRNDIFRARRLIDKPPWFSVSARINLDDHFDAWQTILREFLAEKGIDSEDVIFSTGDLDEGAIPFLYINLLTRVIVLVQYRNLPEDYLQAPPAGHALQAFWHVIRSNTYSVVIRPFSSLQSLMSLTKDTAIQTGRQLVPDTAKETTPPKLSDSPGMDLVAWEQHLDQALDRPASSGHIKFLVDGESFYTRFIDEITSAAESVDIRTYIFDNDDVAMEIADLLRRRSLEGIDVRVLYDGLGTKYAAGAQSETEPSEHRAPASISSYLRKDSRVRVREINNPFMTGDHVKTMVVDREVAFIGGMNIGREYRYDWHDLMVEVRGPIVDEINREFRQAWGNAGPWGDLSFLMNSAAFDRNRKTFSGGYPLRLIVTAPGQEEIYTLQRQAIRNARSYIFIENAYFTDDSLLKELIKARSRGVDVRVIIPLRTDSGLVTRNVLLAANDMLASGIRVYIYPGFSHAKAAIFDGWATVGSANLDQLSLRINKEMNIATSEPVAVQALMDEFFERDFAASTELSEPFDERWTDQLIELFGDYLF